MQLVLGVDGESVNADAEFADFVFKVNFGVREPSLLALNSNYNRCVFTVS